MRKFSSLPHMPSFCSPQCTLKIFIGAEAVDGVRVTVKDASSGGGGVY